MLTMLVHTLYKLTDQNMQTHNRCQWTLGEVKEVSGRGNLCGPGWLHYYYDPILAVMLNPIHADISDPRLFEAEADGERKDDHGLKGGCTRLALLRELNMPEVTTAQHVKFGILCAMQVAINPKWRTWAEDWLSGKDRTKQAAALAAQAERAAARAAALAAARAEWAEWAEWAAAWAAAAALEAVEVKPLDLIALAQQAVNEDE